MKKKLLLLSLLSAAFFTVQAQDSTLTISGSVDTYYKYDFADPGPFGQIPTSFAQDQNSISIGMIDIALTKSISKATFVGEISFGPRGQFESIPNGLDGNSYHIQNLYVSYEFSEMFSMTAGYMGTFVGYEVISPAANFNYSTSYLFTSGPFQNAGIKANFTFSDKVGLMVGLFNDNWNSYRSQNRVNTVGAQLSLSPVEGWDAYLNVVSGPMSGTEFDLTTAYQITDMFKLGLNAATFSAGQDPDTGEDIDGGFSGVALYPQIAVNDAVSLGLRGEYFKVKNGGDVKAITATANIKAGPLTFIPEVRIDSWNDEVFVNKSGDPSKSAAQVILAAVYAF